MSNKRPKNNEKPRIWLIIILSVVLFFGTGFAAFYFNEDVDMANVQEKIYYYITGENADNNLLTLAYCIGVAAGIIIFFNPFMMGKKGGKPTPMEVKYFEYEQQTKDLQKAEQEKGDGG